MPYAQCKYSISPQKPHVLENKVGQTPYLAILNIYLKYLKEIPDVSGPLLKCPWQAGLDRNKASVDRALDPLLAAFRGSALQETR